MVEADLPHQKWQQNTTIVSTVVMKRKVFSHVWIQVNGFTSRLDVKLHHIVLIFQFHRELSDGLQLNVVFGPILTLF